MATIPGASGYLNAATLANRQGVGAQQPSVLGQGGIGAVDILDVARSAGGNNGIGLSSSARALNKQFIESNSSTFNAIFSLGIGSGATIEGMQQKILALRAQQPQSRLARSVVEELEGVGSQALDNAAAAEAAAKEAAGSLSDGSSTLTSQNSGSGLDTNA